MNRYMCIHRWSPGAFTRDQICEMAEATQNDEHVKGYRSFLNLAEGKALCILEAHNAQEVAEWFEKMDLPYEEITQVELEGERGTICEVLPTCVGA